MATHSPASIELPNRALDVDEVAEFLGVCAATVRREVKREHLRAFKVGSVWRIMPEDLAAYLDRDTPAAAAERTDWDAYIRKLAADAPPLRPDQIAALSALFDWEPPAEPPDGPPGERTPGRRGRRSNGATP